MSVHIMIKRYLKTLSKQDFENLLNKYMLSDIEIDIMKRIYVKGQSLIFIAYSLGYSESGKKYRHKKILQKLSCLNKEMQNDGEKQED